MSDIDDRAKVPWVHPKAAKLPIDYLKTLGDGFGSPPEIEPEVREHPHGRGATRAKNTTAWILERAHEIEPIYSRHHVLPQIRRWTMGARLVDGIRNTIKVSVQEAR